jgi:Ca-activated chloride channel homolog
MRRALLITALIAAAVVRVAVQRPDPALPVFRSAVELTTVNATVLDADGRLVTGLPREAFEVYEDGTRQTITHFTNERLPVSLGVLLDVSDSMFGRRIADARAAIQEFLSAQLDPADEFSLVAFNHSQQVLTPWTGDRTILAGLLAPLRPFGSTAIYDALLATLPFAATRHHQRAALLVISDGADTASDYGLAELRAALYRSDAFIYALAIDTPDRRPINAAVNPTTLAGITDQSGGRTTVVRGSAELVPALQGIAEELNSQYLIGYSTSHGADGEYHSIRVRIAGQDYRVRGRRGYVAERPRS